MLYDYVIPPPSSPITAQEADPTMSSVASVALYLGSALEALHGLPENASEWHWDTVLHFLSEAECRMAEALQRVARTERVNRYKRERGGL